MEPAILTDLTLLGRVLTISAAVVLPTVALHRAGEWLRSRRQRALTRGAAAGVGSRERKGASDQSGPLEAGPVRERWVRR